MHVQPRPPTTTITRRNLRTTDYRTCGLQHYPFHPNDRRGWFRETAHKPPNTNKPFCFSSFPTIQLDQRSTRQTLVLMSTIYVTMISLDCNVQRMMAGMSDSRNVLDARESPLTFFTE